MNVGQISHREDMRTEYDLTFDWMVIPGENYSNCTLVTSISPPDISTSSRSHVGVTNGTDNYIGLTPGRMYTFTVKLQYSGSDIYKTYGQTCKYLIIYNVMLTKCKVI